jgi:hypothetical protein
MYPHERSLVQQYKNRPFALIGVNTDSDIKTLKQVQDEGKYPGRSFWDGKGGPICAEWKIKGFPTIVMIDAKGTVRFSHLGPPPGDQLDKEIETLVKEAEK